MIICEFCKIPIDQNDPGCIIENFHNAPKYLADVIVCPDCRAAILERGKGGGG